MTIRPLLFVSALLILGGCASTQTQNASKGDKLTVGVVQKEIHKGMSGSQVIEALGSPNLVSTDEKGREVWVYDKTSTERVETNRSAFAWILILGASKDSSQQATTQKTLTVIVKFDEDKKVRDLAYHSSQF